MFYLFLIYSYRTFCSKFLVRFLNCFDIRPKNISTTTFILPHLYNIHISNVYFASKGCNQCYKTSTHCVYYHSSLYIKLDRIGSIPQRKQQTKCQHNVSLCLNALLILEEYPITTANSSEILITAIPPDCNILIKPPLSRTQRI